MGVDPRSLGSGPGKLGRMLLMGVHTIFSPLIGVLPLKCLQQQRQPTAVAAKTSTPCLTRATSPSNTFI
jgi:hypothetical protein